ncbi:MarR family winged helix-turn-helix transcriptional regulator, partial [Hydrogenophaga sp.]|uniref:MarR family winged helix-turn-helix transcriptional regulator n=1 Tax=Hydrogenophaga sp. TaxID=1904254 RepID=UPI00345550CB
GAATRAAVERGGPHAPPGRPKAEQPPRGAATRAAVERGGARFTDDYLGYLLGQANHALFKDFDAVVRDAGLSSIEWRALATLTGRPPMPVGQLAFEVLSQQPTVTKLVQRLAAQGWVALRDDPDDQRRTLVNITPAGQKKVAPLIARAREHEAAVLGTLSAAEVRRLKDQLRRLAQPG